MLMSPYHPTLESPNKALTSPATAGNLRFETEPKALAARNNRSGSNNNNSSSTVAAHTKMRLLTKVEQNMRQNQHQSQGHPQQHRQQQHQNVNRLIHTAATGNGVVGDVDDGLLTPMRNKPLPYSGNVQNTSNSGGIFKAETRAERNLWSRAEMLEMLSIMQNIKALEQLKDRNIKSEHVFRQIEQIMRSKNYVKKSSIQIWTKWKFLKSTYNTTTRHGIGVPKVVPEEVYRVLCRMLGGGSDGGSIGGSGSVAGGSNSNISECGNSMDSSKTLGEDTKEDILGVEHPIFGFRLGPIKPEPLDTGYDDVVKAPDNMSEQDTRETLDFEPSVQITHSDHSDMANHTPFIVSVKHEPEMDLGMDGTNTPPPTAPASPSPPPIALGDHDDEDLYNTSTSTMPPLRVASFAKGGDHGLRRSGHGMMPMDRQPPTLSKSKLNRSLPLQSTSSINFVHPTSKLMLPRKLPVRLPRDISVQPAGMRLKPVPIRDTGYSLRPERMIPDLEQSISPPQSPTSTHNQQSLLSRGQPPRYSIPPYAASTSRQAQLMSEQHLQRKRRIAQNSSPVPVKLQRSSMHYEPPLKTSLGSLFDEDEQKPSTSESQRKRLMEQHEQKLDDIFNKELTQLAAAMREAQSELLEDFFKQQREFARREHEFQMRQDNLVMQALRKQTDALLRTANELLGKSSETNESTNSTKVDQPESPDKKVSTEVPETELPAPETIIEEGNSTILDNEDDDDSDQDPTDDNDDDDDDEEEDDELDEEAQLDDRDEVHGSNESDMDMSTLAMSASAVSEDDGINADF